MLKNAIVVCLLIVNSAALAADKHVTIKGCASAGVENCLFITSPQGRYALYVTPPRPVPGRGIRVTGTISERPKYLHDQAEYQSRDVALHSPALPKMSAQFAVTLDGSTLASMCPALGSSNTARGPGQET
jgi:hypothetical protein